MSSATFERARRKDLRGEGLLGAKQQMKIKESIRSRRLPERRKEAVGAGGGGVGGGGGAGGSSGAEMRLNRSNRMTEVRPGTPMASPASRRGLGARRGRGLSRGGEAGALFVLISKGLGFGFFSRRWKVGRTR